MKTYLQLYTDYLICTDGSATATGLSSVVDGAVSHDQVTRFLSHKTYSSKDLWLEVKGLVRQIEAPDAVLIFDDTICEKEWTDENDIICWHFDHCKGRSVKGINLLNALYHSGDVSVPIAFEIIQKTIEFYDEKTSTTKRRSEMSKNELMRGMFKVCVENQVEFRYVLLDSWYSAVDNFHTIVKKTGLTHRDVINFCDSLCLSDNSW